PSEKKVSAATSQRLPDILASNDGVERNYWFQQYLNQLSPDNAMHILTELEALPKSSKRTDMLNKFFRKWGELAGVGAYQHALNYGGADGLSFQQFALEGWALRDPASAWETFQSVSNNGNAWNARIGPILGAVARSDLGLALQYVQDFKDPFRQQWVMGSIISVATELGQRNVLLQKVGSMEDKNQQSLLTETLFKEWGKVDNELSMQAVENLGDPAMVEAAMRGLMAGWATQDGKAALDYALQNADDPLYKELAVKVAQDWSRAMTPSEVGALIATINAAENRSQLMEAAIYSVASADPDRAVAWVQSIADIKQKNQLMSQVLWNMARSDYASAKTYFDQLPDDEARSTSSWAMVNSAVATGQSLEDTLSLLEGYEDYKKRDSAMENLIYVATMADNLHKSKELRAELLKRVESSDSLEAEKREELLNRLKRNEG
ncbi:MAG: hypothetical protein KJT03_01555, partial [Verrucomicrobiae bacterium]|nr:hypothetical protein [Verrucomicrobiae bacterium]